MNSLQSTQAGGEVLPARAHPANRRVDGYLNLLFQKLLVKLYHFYFSALMNSLFTCFAH